MAKSLTIPDLPVELERRLEDLSRASGQSVPATALELLLRALQEEPRRLRLERYVDWTAADRSEFDAALRGATEAPAASAFERMQAYGGVADSGGQQLSEHTGLRLRCSGSAKASAAS